MGDFRAALGVVALVMLTGCSATSGTGSTSGPARSGACRAASPDEIDSVKAQLRDGDLEMVDAYVVPVPVVEQLPEGFPDLILAARFNSPTASATEKAQTGTWSLGEANNVKTVFPLDETARQLANSAIRVDSDLGQMFSKFSDSDAALAARACSNG